MHASTSSLVYRRRGKTTSKIVRSCDTVRAGAFFPHVQLQVPQKERRQHRREHMVVPARVFAPFILGHAQRRFRFFKALLDRPAHATEPDKGPHRCAHWGIAEVVSIGLFTPTVRWLTSHTVRSGRPSLPSVTRVRAKLINIGPFVPSSTLAR